MNRLNLTFFFYRFFLAVLICGFRVNSSGAEIRTMPHNGLADIAFATFDQFGPVVYYNPAIMNSVPKKVGQFIMSHEKAHFELDHITRQMLAGDPFSRIAIDRQNEIEADKYATEYWLKRDKSVVEAAINHFESPRGNYGDLTHLPTALRAQLMRGYMRDSNDDDDERTSNNSRSKRSRNTQNSWTTIKPEIADLELDWERPDWGNKRSGIVRVKGSIKNTSSDVTYKVELQVATVRITRDDNDVTGSIEKKTETVELAPDESADLRFSLRWASDDWQPTEEEMPGIRMPKLSDSNSDHREKHTQLKVWKSSSAKKRSRTEEEE